MKLLVSGLVLFILTCSCQAKSTNIKKSESCSIIPDYKDGTYYNISMLGVAAFKNDPDVIDQLISGGCDVNYNGTAVEHFWDDYGSVEYFDDDDDGHVSGITPLHIACIQGSEEVVVKLLDVSGIDINAQDEFGGTPVYYAASWGHYEIVSLLAEAGADIIIPDYLNGTYFNISMLGVAVFKNDPGVIDQLIIGGCDGGCDVNYNGTAFEYFDEDDELYHTEGITPLHIACIYGYEEVVVKLLNVSGIDINAQDSYGSTPLYDAASWGYYEIVSLLVEAGADLELADIEGATPVHVAATYGYIDTVKTLAEHGANLDVKGGNDKDTPLHQAVYYGYREVVQYLIDQGVDLNIKDSEKKTALYWARYNNYRRIVKMLKEAGATL